MADGNREALGLRPRNETAERGRTASSVCDVVQEYAPRRGGHARPARPSPRQPSCPSCGCPRRTGRAARARPRRRCMTRASAVASDPMWLLTPAAPGTESRSAVEVARDLRVGLRAQDQARPRTHAGKPQRLHRQVQQHLFSGPRQVWPRRRCPAASAAPRPPPARATRAMRLHGSPVVAEVVDEDRRRGRSTGERHSGARRGNRATGRRGEGPPGGGDNGRTRRAGLQIEGDSERQGENGEEDRSGGNPPPAGAQAWLRRPASGARAAQHLEPALEDGSLPSRPSDSGSPGKARTRSSG